MSTAIIDLFSGPRGWSEGLRELGREDIGIEIDRDACRTAINAGHATIQADVTQYTTEPFVGKVEGLIASPPCTDWSTAGKQKRWEGESGRLVLEVDRWVRALRPRWVACEQVPPALEVWVRFAHEFTSLGYRCWAGILNAADFGVPQTRRRAFLLCSLDRQPQPPGPTHARNPHPAMFGESRLPWVSMADALGWNGEMFYQRGAGMIERHERSCDRPAPTVDRKVGKSWTLHTNRGQDEQGNLQTRECTAPAPALTAKAGGQWAFDRPSTTVCGTDRVGRPGHKDWNDNESQFDRDVIRLSVRDALILQSFRPDYPLAGNKTSCFTQIGNAVPPRLAKHVLGALLDRGTV